MLSGKEKKKVIYLAHCKYLPLPDNYCEYQIQINEPLTHQQIVQEPLYVSDNWLSRFLL